MSSRRIESIADFASFVKSPSWQGSFWSSNEGGQIGELLEKHELASIAGFDPEIGGVTVAFKDQKIHSAEFYQLDIEIFGKPERVDVSSSEDLLRLLKEALESNAFVMGYASPKRLTIGFVAVGSTGAPKLAELPLLKLKDSQELASFMSLIDAIDKTLDGMGAGTDLIPVDQDPTFL